MTGQRGGGGEPESKTRSTFSILGASESESRLRDGGREREREKNESESETRNPILEDSQNCPHQRGPHRTVFVFDGFAKWALVGVLFPHRKTDYSVWIFFSFF